MDGREGGRINLYHRLWSSPDLSGFRAQHLFVFATILHLANWKPGCFWVGKTRVDVARGELAHSLKTIAEEARATIREVRTTLDNLLRRGILDSRYVTEGDTHIRVLRVVNYDVYQPKPSTVDTGDDTTNDTTPTRRRHEGDTTPTLIESRESRESSKDPPSADAVGLSLTPPPAPKKKTKTADPAVEALRADLEAAHRDIRHAELDWPPSAYGDLQAIRKALADDAEVKRRWGLFLATEFWPIKNVHKFRDAFQHARFANNVAKPKEYATTIEMYKHGIPEYR